MDLSERECAQPRIGRLPRRVRELADHDDAVRWLIEGYGLGLGHSGGDQMLVGLLAEADVPELERAEALLARWARMQRTYRYAIEMAERVVAEAAL